MDRITSTRVDDDDRLRLPPIPPPQSSGTEKKESQDRHHNQACRPSGKRSSTSSRDLHPDNVPTVTCSLQISPSLKGQSSASWTAKSARSAWPDSVPSRNPGPARRQAGASLRTA